MKILDKISQLKKKQTIYWDVDDIILNTNQTIINLINKKFLISSGKEEKSENDIKDWGFKSIYNKLTHEQKIELFESEEFWQQVEVKKEFLNLAKSGILKKYNNIFITHGTQKNLEQKREYLYNNKHIKNYIKDFEYIGILLNEKKSKINMKGSIQIDDNYNNLKDTNSHLKILVKNNIENNYNNSYGFIDTPDNLYNVNDLNDILEILEFNLKNQL